MTDSCCSDEESPDRNWEMKNPFADGVGRRKMLQASAAGAAVSMAGCLGGDGDGNGGENGNESENGDESGTDGQPTVYVFNTGDRTVSVLDAEADELVTTEFLGSTASFPANQYGTSAESDYEPLWLNTDSGALAVDPSDFSGLAEVETGFGSNYPNLTPDGEYLIIASGGSLGMDPDPEEPEDQFYYRVDANRDSESFGEVTDEVQVGYDGPCDMTVGPDGEYAYAVDVANETITVLQVDPFEIATRVGVGESITEGGDVLPFMCTASFDGEYLLVENGEGELGPEGERSASESIWDISDPENPEEITKITPEDGLPGLAITSEIDPDSEVGYLFIPGEGVGVVDIQAGEYQETLDIGGNAIAGAWGPNREKLYVPVQSENQVAVIDNGDREVTATVDVGEAPAGAAASTVRPDQSVISSMRTSLAEVGVTLTDTRATYCYPDCYCGGFE